MEKLVKEQGIWAVRKHCLFHGIVKIYALQALPFRKKTCKKNERNFAVKCSDYLLE